MLAIFFHLTELIWKQKKYCMVVTVQASAAAVVLASEIAAVLVLEIVAVQALETAQIILNKVL